MQQLQKTFLLCLLLFLYCGGFSQKKSERNYLYALSTLPKEQQDAILFLDSVGTLEKSNHWPNIDPEQLLENLRVFSFTPLRFYEGKGTNFCAYSAITYIPLNYDPEGFARFMITLYQTGKATMGKVHFNPSKAVKKEAGKIKYKGALDINPAGQMWFLSLADRFKGYLNLFNRNFNKGDENTLWASTNFAKFNRMIRRLFDYKVKARGSDLIRPWISDTYGYLKEKSSKGPVFLYLNNRLLYKKKHITTRFGIPTHFVLLLSINQSYDGKVDMIYWDYGKKTLQQVSPHLLKKIIFGITHFYPEE